LKTNAGRFLARSEPAKKGDTITSIAGQSVTGAQAVADVLLTLKPGQKVPVQLQ